MINKIYLVTDLGSGDGGKGGVVHKIANAMNSSVVLKFGAGQGSHGIVTATGEKFNFSHWGCGTLEGIPTFITDRFVVIPHAIVNEGNDLRHRGLADPYKLLSVSPSCICATPYHRLASQIKELLRKDKPRGTIGTGAGEAYRMYLKHKNLLTIVQPIRMAEVMSGGEELKLKLRNTVDYYRHQFGSYREADFLPADRATAANLFSQLFDDDLLEWTLMTYAQLTQTSLQLQTLPQILAQHHGNAVAECSHGVLTDSKQGFAPHTSAIRTLPQLVQRDLYDAGFAGRIVRLGVTRAYAIRHGAGPLPTADAKLSETLLPGSHKEDNRWQGKVRVGALDFVLLNYAVKCCGGAEAFDGLCVTWADQIQVAKKWQFCTEYQNFSGEFTTGALNQAIPQITTLDVASLSQEQLGDLIRQTFRQNVGVPVRMISFGSDDQNKFLY